jgi:hypothetical protein
MVDEPGDNQKGENGVDSAQKEFLHDRTLALRLARGKALGL